MLIGYRLSVIGVRYRLTVYRLYIRSWWI